MERNTIAEMRQILDALEQGKAVQVWNDEYQNWFDTDGYPNFRSHTYSIKPEEPKGRPFTNAEELDKAIVAHGPFIRNVNTGVRIIIDAYNSKEVKVLGMEKPMEELLKNYTFVDGTPCGVLEEGT